MSQPQPMRISVAAFGAVPDGSDALPGLRAAAEACQGRSDVRLVIPPGRYACRDAEAIAAFAELAVGTPPVNVLVGPDRGPYRRALAFAGCRDLAIEADGAVLVFHGLIQPLEFIDCAGVAVRGLTIDWDRSLRWMRQRGCFNYRPAVFAYRSRNLRLEALTIHAAPGMGVLAQRCSDIVLDQVQVVPGAGRDLSTVTDATHFACCSGTISVSNCRFQAMGDDAINVHGFYLTIGERIGDDAVRATVQTMHPQAMVFPVPEAGAAVELVRPDTLLPYATGRLAAVEADRSAWTAVLRFAAPVPAELRPGDLIADLDAVARLRFIGNTVCDLRARGALVQTRDAIIADNRIERCTGTGIVVDTAMGWGESIGTRQVVIRDNRILDCGDGSGTYAGASGIAVVTECAVPAIGVHRDLEITGNEIAASGDSTAIVVRCASAVRVAGNRATGCARLLEVEQVDGLTATGNALVGPEALPWVAPARLAGGAPPRFAKTTRIRDPCILPAGEDGRYHLIGSTHAASDGAGDGLGGFWSSDLERWFGPLPLLAPGTWTGGALRAPQVRSWRGRWLLCAGLDPGGRSRGVGILAADQPLGPYRQLGDGPLTPPDRACLDGLLHVDAADRPWLVFNQEASPDGPGAICAMLLREDLTAADGPPTALFTAPAAPWAGRLAGAGGVVASGPCLHRGADGRLILLWSARGEAGHALGVAISEADVLGPWRHQDQPLVGQDGGRGTLVRDTAGVLRLAMHQPDASPRERLRLLRIAEDAATGLRRI
jgi:hypothetical protein